MKLSDYNKIHEGETIYLIGNGPDLHNISESYKEKIANGISIGVNASHLFLPQTTYHCCGHWSHYLLNCEYGSVAGCRFFQGPKIDEGPRSLDSCFHEDNKTLDISRNSTWPFNDTSVIFNEINENSSLLGAEQIAFAATHFACIMGAKKIVYLGFDQRSSTHFYDEPEYKKIIKEQTDSLIEKYKNDYFLKHDLEDFYAVIDKTASLCFLSRQDAFKSKFSGMFNVMLEHGTTPIVHNRDSIVFDSGAELRDYDD